MFFPTMVPEAPAFFPISKMKTSVQMYVQQNKYLQ